MIQLYKIGTVKPLTKNETEELNQNSFLLPSDYIDFLMTYGLGSINELFMIQKPDGNYIKSNFGDYMDFWTLTENEEQLILNSQTISTTIDGDIITVIDNNQKPIVLLPRHSEEVVYFENFERVIAHYDQKYNFNSDLYFDTNYNFEQEYISFVKDGQLNKKQFDDVYEIFLNEVSFDKVHNPETQPKYSIQKIGGWVYFDALGKSAVRVKYQTQFKEEADEIIKLIKDQMKN